jgi:hypothetical protein
VRAEITPEVDALAEYLSRTAEAEPELELEI